MDWHVEACFLAGPVTVFAPFNDAFAALSPEVKAVLQKDPELLTKVLQYHVTDGETYSNKLYNDMLIPSLAPGLNMRVNTYYKRTPGTSDVSKVTKVIDMLSTSNVKLQEIISIST